MSAGGATRRGFPAAEGMANPSSRAAARAGVTRSPAATKRAVARGLVTGNFTGFTFGKTDTGFTTDTWVERWEN